VGITVQVVDFLRLGSATIKREQHSSGRQGVAPVRLAKQLTWRPASHESSLESNWARAAVQRNGAHDEMEPFSEGGVQDIDLQAGGEMDSLRDSLIFAMTGRVSASSPEGPALRRRPATIGDTTLHLEDLRAELARQETSSSLPSLRLVETTSLPFRAEWRAAGGNDGAGWKLEDVKGAERGGKKVALMPQRTLAECQEEIGNMEAQLAAAKKDKRNLQSELAMAEEERQGLRDELEGYADIVQALERANEQLQEECRRLGGGSRSETDELMRMRQLALACQRAEDKTARLRALCALRENAAAARNRRHARQRMSASITVWVQCSTANAFRAWSVCLQRRKETGSVSLQVDALTSQLAQHAEEGARLRAEAAARCNEIVRRALSRLSRQLVARALETWAAAGVHARRLRVVASRALRRWRGAALALALTGWQHEASQCRRRRQKVRAAVARMCFGVEAAAVQRWREQARSQATGRAQVGRALRCMVQSSVARALERWRAVHRTAAAQRRKMAKVLAWLTQGTLVHALQVWRRVTLKNQADRGKMARVVARLGHRYLVQALEMWQCTVHEAHRQRRKLAQVMHRFWHGGLVRALETWAETTRTQRIMKHKIATVVQRMTHGGLVRALETWAETTRTQHIMKHKIATVVQRMTHGGLVRSFQRWTDNVQEDAMRRRTIAAVVARLSLRAVGSAFDAWIALCDLAAREWEVEKRSLQESRGSVQAALEVQVARFCSLGARAAGAMALNHRRTAFATLRAAVARAARRASAEWHFLRAWRRAAWAGWRGREGRAAVLRLVGAGLRREAGCRALWCWRWGARARRQQRHSLEQRWGRAARRLLARLMGAWRTATSGSAWAAMMDARDSRFTGGQEVGVSKRVCFSTFASWKLAARLSANRHLGLARSTPARPFAR